MTDEELMERFVVAMRLLVDRVHEIQMKREMKPIRRRKRGPEEKPRKKGRKLYAAQALAIFKSRAPVKDLAEKYDVHTVTVNEIKRGRTWSKLTGKSYTKVGKKK